ncbi:galactosylgalactosylxylosylprotein 3-beta-glucuronosyltransferase 3-like [Diadema antillarum]|uniref:galactosylgalactosylxylosylprotein 3-beta-glucuronosyltransferase 3-like n=1 Tax=Diadema antillarum TaxID=105358 RepID=UPI003A842906
MRRVLRTRALFAAYFLISSGSILWLASTCGIGCLDSVQGHQKDTMADYYKEELQRTRNSARQMERNMKKVIEKLNRQHPRAAEIVEKTLTNSTASFPTIYAITPTYTRPVQKAELTRLGHTFSLVRNFHWIVVEDSEHKTRLVANFLANCGLSYTHLHVKTLDEYKLKENEPAWRKPRGVDQRNIAIDWIVENVREKEAGVVYFADDDNTYSLKLFDEMRTTQKVSVWPVGLVGGLRFERPIVDKQGKVSSWYVVWEPDRPFAMDMAGFAINLRLFRQQPHARFDITSKRGYVETSLLTQLGITKNDLEPKADMCTKVLVWHTRTEKPKWKQEDKLIAMGKPSDPRIEV